MIIKMISSLVLVTTFLSTPLSGVNGTRPFSEQEDQVKVRPLRDPERFGIRARIALDEGRLDDALDLVLQANDLDPSSQNRITYGQVLVYLGRFAEGYRALSGAIVLSDRAREFYDVPVIIAYANASMKMKSFEEAKALYALSLEMVADPYQRGVGEGRLKPLNPKASRDPHWLEAASLAGGLYTDHQIPSMPPMPKTDVELLARFKAIDRLAPSWERIWPLLFWNVEASSPTLTIFVRSKIGRLKNSSDPEVRRSVEVLQKYRLHGLR